MSRSRTETPIQVPPVQQQLPARAAPVLLQEQFQLKQMMMEKQLELLQKQVSAIYNDFIIFDRFPFSNKFWNKNYIRKTFQIIRKKKKLLW